MNHFWRRPWFFAVVGIILVAVIALAVLSRPTTIEQPLSVDARNGQAYEVLAGQGILEVMVDITDERSLIRANTTADDALAWRLLGTAAAVAPDVPLIVVQLVSGGTPAAEIIAPTQTVRDYLAGVIDREAFDEQVDWDTY